MKRKKSDVAWLLAILQGAVPEIPQGSQRMLRLLLSPIRRPRLPPTIVNAVNRIQPSVLARPAKVQISILRQLPQEKAKRRLSR
jgi:hypothetical protein